MNVTALEEYGLRCAVQLATLPEGQTLSAPEIAENEGLSVEYVSKFMLLLKRADLVRTVRGIKGGFALTRAPGEISLKAVFDALNGKSNDAHNDFCNSFSGKQECCVRTANCNIRPFWRVLNDYIDEFTTQMTLLDLVRTENETQIKTKAIANQSIAKLRLNDRLKDFSVRATPYLKLKTSMYPSKAKPYLRV